MAWYEKTTGMGRRRKEVCVSWNGMGTDTPRGLKPHGFSGEPSDPLMLQGSGFAPRWRCPRLGGRCLPRGVAWGAHHTAAPRGAHRVPGTCLLVPVGPMYHGT